MKNTKVYKSLDNIQKKWNNAKKLARAGARMVRFIMFIISNPVGWIVGILLGLVIYNSADAFQGVTLQGGDLTSNAHRGNQNRIGNQSQNDQLTVEGNVILIDCKKQEQEGDKSTSDSVSSGNVSESDWTKEGTRAHTNAKKTFESWVSKGLSGTAAAGIVGWVESEGGFYMVGRAEGRHSNVLEESSLKYGAVPLVSGQGYSVGGGGIYQFTPYTKYAPLSDPAWEDIDKMTAFVVKSLPSDWNPGHDLSGKNQSLEQFAKQTDIADATLAWNAYEKGDPRYIPKDKKIKDGQKANEIFNKDNIKFDEAKFNENFGKSSGGGSSSSSPEPEDSKKRCKNTKSKGGGKGWYKHKDGKADPSVGAWTKESLPDGLKPYALDPESLGMKFSSKDGWECLAYVGNQCTDLTASLAYKLWAKDGKHPKQARGNGVNVADNWAATFGGDVSHEPKAGSIFSNAEGSEYGHTGIVSHVFEDESILIIEQNYAGKSGAAVGQTFTWNYRMVSASDAKKWKYYDPETQGYSIVDDAKAVA